MIPRPLKEAITVAARVAEGDPTRASRARAVWKDDGTHVGDNSAQLTRL